MGRFLNEIQGRDFWGLKTITWLCKPDYEQGGRTQERFCSCRAYVFRCFSFSNSKKSPGCEDFKLFFLTPSDSSVTIVPGQFVLVALGRMEDVQEGKRSVSEHTDSRATMMHSCTCENAQYVPLMVHEIILDGT